MSRAKKELFSIYLMLDKEKKAFYISHCNPNSLRETYRHNVAGHRTYPLRFVEDTKPNRPCMFVLETVNGTKHARMRLFVAWTKIFIENGYQCYNNPSLIEMTENLYEETNRLYEERKQRNFQDIIACTNCMVPSYKRIRCEHYQGEIPPVEKTRRKRNHALCTMVSYAELDIIKANAQKAHMQLSPYIRSIAMNPTIIVEDYSAITEHTRTLAEIRDGINRIAFTISILNNYLPRDMETIVSYMQEISKTEKELLAQFCKNE